MHELGVRIALGAQARDVVRLVMGQGLRFTLAGMVAGLLLVVALVASWIPAVRATRAEPNTALRADLELPRRLKPGGYP